MTTTAELTKQLLEYHGCIYEENVVHQLNEYAKKLMKTILDGASNLADMQKRQNITTEDIKFIIHIQNPRIAYEYLQNPTISMNDLIQVASEKNSQQLNDQFKDQTNYDARLPASETNKLLKPNFQVIVKTQPDQIPLVQQQMEIEKNPNKQQQQQQAPKLGRKKMNIEMDEDQ
ncbi:unnamed protein product (macronuclear) [Paramecium tetraurelia]|uniref:Transcription initiation factor TFIID subunit 12 domain-containing protein n=1 Tax=Paramecium tetraurelia TaxID=5888 RepID=A0DYS2_PARTE|nr:uncharacterized protein GSPATT00003157001 [Paramecium tetraurelia]CAK88189.1 unnamed protein product [Paramecium tetraurelia]|eukprot:XP_001455586.1 hypothetical protein (macronuclear) [Paramecium tetraurelia strain d4-2]